MTICLNEVYTSPHGDLRFGRSGQGPDIVLCHGTPTSSRVWHHVIPDLARDFTVHYLDLPGYGMSEKREGQDVRLRAFAQSLAGLCRHLGLKRPHLVGHDFGAATVLGAHLVEGLDIASLVIADGVVLSPWGTPFSRHVRDHEQVFAAVPGYVHEAVLAAHLRTALSQIPDPDLLAALIAPWTGPVGQAAYYRQVGQYDYDYTRTLEGLYPGISVPLTVLWGRNDRWVDIAEGRRFAAMVEGAQFVELPDAGHFSMLDTPDAFAQALRAALARHA